MYRQNLYLCLGLVLVISACGVSREEGSLNAESGMAVLQATPGRPSAFPHRIWAACDFELSRNDVMWLGAYETADIPSYPGNRTAAGARPVPGGEMRFLGIKPSYYPRMGRANSIYFEYFLKGTGSISLQLFNQDKNLCHQARLTGLAEGEWSEATVDLSRVPSGPNGRIVEGERMDDLIMFVEPAQKGGTCELMVDDIICFSDNGKEETPSGEPFPRRVICLWSFDVVDNYHPWTHRNYWVLRKGEMPENDWGVAQALPQENKTGKRIRLIIDPPQQVGSTTKLRFRYFLKGTSSFQVQIFDLTDRDNRHIVIEGVEQGIWQWANLDFTKNGIKNDGNQTPFKVGNLVDDIFFFPLGAGEDAELLIDEVVLYDAGDS